MKSVLIFTIATTFFAFQTVSAAEETMTAPTTIEAAPAANTLQSRYQLTDAELKQINDSSVSEPQREMVANLARKSGKSVDEVLKMRIEQKMGWGKIAKELGVDPKEMGQAVSDSHHMDKSEKRAEKAAAKAERKERKEAMKEKRENKIRK